MKYLPRVIFQRIADLFKVFYKSIQVGGSLVYLLFVFVKKNHFVVPIAYGKIFKKNSKKFGSFFFVFKNFINYFNLSYPIEKIQSEHSGLRVDTSCLVQACFQFFRPSKNKCCSEKRFSSKKIVLVNLN